MQAGVPVSGADANGAVTETAQPPRVQITATDSGSGSDAVGAFKTVATDAGSGVETASLLPTAGLVVRLDASQLALADGATVSPWPNVASAGIPGTMVGSPAPTFRAGRAPSLLPVVRFLAGQGAMRMTGTGITTPFTLLIVAHLTSTGANAQRIAAADYAAVPSNNLLFGWWNNYQDALYDGGWAAGEPSVAATTQWKLYSFDKTGASPVRLFSDGTYLKSGGSGTQNLGNTFDLSGYNGTGTQETSDCEVAEVLIYNRVLSDTERQQAESYLRNKWFRLALSSSDSGTGTEGTPGLRITTGEPFDNTYGSVRSTYATYAAIPPAKATYYALLGGPFPTVTEATLRGGIGINVYEPDQVTTYAQFQALPYPAYANQQVAFPSYAALQQAPKQLPTVTETTNITVPPIISGDSNGTTTETASYVTSASGTDSGTAVETATVVAVLSAADASGATTEATRTFLAGTDANAATTEAISQRVISDADADGALTETTGTRLAASDTNGTTTEAFAFVKSDADTGTITETTATRLSAADANGITTEATVQTTTFVSTDANGTVTEVATVLVVSTDAGTGADAATPRALVSGVDASGSTSEVTAALLITTSETNGAVTEATATALYASDANGAVTEATPTLVKTLADSNGTTTEATALVITTADASGPLTETTNAAQVASDSGTGVESALPVVVTSGDSNGATTEATGPLLLSAVADAGSAAEAISQRALTDADAGSTSLEKGTLSYSPRIEGTQTTNGNTTATSHAVTLPATVSVASLLMIFGRCAATGTVSIPGWTLFQDSTDNSDDVTFWGYRNTLAGAGEGGTTATVTHGSGFLAAVCCSVTGAADPAVLPPEGAWKIDNSQNGSVDAPLLTPTGGTKDYLFFTSGSGNNSFISAGYPPSDATGPFTSLANFTTGGTNLTGVGFALAYRREAAVASSDPAGWGWGQDLGIYLTAFTVAVYPTPSTAVGGTDTNGTLIESATWVLAIRPSDAEVTTETQVLVAQSSTSDAATAAESAVSSFAQSSTDAGGATETATVARALLASADTGTGTDSAAATGLPVSASDTNGTTAEAGAVGQVTTDAPGVAEGAVLALSGSDTATDSEVGSLSAVRTSDTDSGTDSEAVLSIRLPASDANGATAEAASRRAFTPWTLTDTGLTVTDKITGLPLRPLADTALVLTDSLARAALYARTTADTGLVQSDVLQRVIQYISRALTDAGLAQSDVLRRSVVTRMLADTALTLTDKLPITRAQKLADTALALTDTLRISGRGYALTDTGLTLSDVLRLTARPQTLTDVGLVQTDVLRRLAPRALLDIGLVQSDALARRIAPALADTGLSLTDVLRLGRPITLTDTGLVQSDVLRRPMARPLADVGLVMADTLVRTRVLRALADTGLTVMDAVAPTPILVLLDMGLAMADSLRTARARLLADTGLVLGDALIAARPGKLADTGLVLSDALSLLVTRQRTDVALVMGDSVQAVGSHGRALADTALVVSDSLARLTNVRVLADTGLLVVEVMQRGVTRQVGDTGLVVADSLAYSRRRAAEVVDTALVLADSVEVARVARMLADSGLAQADTIHVPLSGRALADTALVMSDLLVRSGRFTRAISEVALTPADATRMRAARLLMDVALVLTEELATGPPKQFLIDAGLVQSDELHAVQARALADVGLALTDLLEAVVAPLLTTPYEAALVSMAAFAEIVSGYAAAVLASANGHAQVVVETAGAALAQTALAEIVAGETAAALSRVTTVEVVTRAGAGVEREDTEVEIEDDTEASAESLESDALVTLS